MAERNVDTAFESAAFFKAPSPLRSAGAVHEDLVGFDQSRNAVRGLVGLAVIKGAAKPDSKAARPASTAIANARAIRFGSVG